MEPHPLPVGFVYVLTNPATPHQVKVGRTDLLPEDRARDLYEGNTSVSDPFEVTFIAMTSRSAAVEKRTHERLRDHRINPRREFFGVSVDVAIEAVRHATVEVAGILSWVASRPHLLRSGDRLALALEAGQVFALVSYPDINRLLIGSPEIDLWQAHADSDILEIFGSGSASHVAGFATDDPGTFNDPLPHLDRCKTMSNGVLNGRERLVPGERLVWLPNPSQAKSQSSVVFEAEVYCQIVSRTWGPQRGPDGSPLLLNSYTHDKNWPEGVSAVQEALDLPPPRRWAPRGDCENDWVPIGVDQQPPEYWLPQLMPRSRKRRKS